MLILGVNILRHGETIDILTIAQFVVYQEKCVYDPQYKVKMLR